MNQEAWFTVITMVLIALTTFALLNVFTFWNSYGGTSGKIAVISLTASVFGVIGVFIFGAMAIGTHYERNICHDHARGLQLESRFSSGQGCRVKDQNGRWIELEKYRWELED